jgi:hypothetical protein
MTAAVWRCRRANSHGQRWIGQKRTIDFACLTAKQREMPENFAQSAGSGFAGVQQLQDERR